MIPIFGTSVRKITINTNRSIKLDAVIDKSYRVIQSRMVPTVGIFYDFRVFLTSFVSVFKINTGSSVFVTTCEKIYLLFLALKTTNTDYCKYMFRHNREVVIPSFIMGYLTKVISRVHIFGDEGSTFSGSTELDFIAYETITKHLKSSESEIIRLFEGTELDDVCDRRNLTKFRKKLDHVHERFFKGTESHSNREKKVHVYEFLTSVYQEIFPCFRYPEKVSKYVGKFPYEYSVTLNMFHFKNAPNTQSSYFYSMSSFSNLSSGTVVYLLSWLSILRPQFVCNSKVVPSPSNLDQIVGL